VCLTNAKGTYFEVKAKSTCTQEAGADNGFKIERCPPFSRTSIVRRNFLGTAALALFLCGTGQAKADLIVNGSFETPIVPNGSFSNFSQGSSALTGWTVFGAAGGVSIVSGTFVQNGVTFNAEDGTQWLDLTGDGTNSNEGVSQAVTTTVGHLYELSYWVGNTTGGSIFGTTSTVLVSLNGVPTLTSTNSNADSTGLNWEQFTYTFVAGASTITLAFQNGDPPSDNSNGLDNVVLTDLGPAGISGVAPEPASLAMVATGVAFLALTRRKWRFQQPPVATRGRIW
jgi:hypothetical protein